MEMKKIIRYWEYLFVIIIFFIVLKENAFKGLALLDYSYITSFSCIHFLKMNSFTSFSPFCVIGDILSRVGLVHILLQISLLIAMLISFHFLKKIVKKNALFVFAVFFLNPFFYTRIIVGQIGLVISYLLLPISFYYLKTIIVKKYRPQDILKYVIAVIISGLFAFHSFLINGIIAFLFVSVYWNKISFAKIRKMAILGVFLFLVLSAFWIQGFFENFNLKIDSINEDDKKFFSPKRSESIPTVSKVMGLWGFWREKAYVNSYSSIPLWLWYFSVFAIVSLMLLGYYSEKDNTMSKIYLSMFWIGLLFSVGFSHPFVKPIFDFLFTNVPFFNGFRDSHKFVILLVFAYSFLIPQGVYYLSHLLSKVGKTKLPKRIIRFTVLILALLIILINAFPIIGLWNQIDSVSYPDSYSEIVNQNQDNNALGIYLPWELYLTYNWSYGSSPDGRITNPIVQYPDVNFLVSSGLWGISSSEKIEISKCLREENISCLQKAGIGYVYMDKCALYPNVYTWINDSPVYSNECFDVYSISNMKTANVEKAIPTRFFIGFSITVLGFISLLFLRRRFLK